MLFSSLPWAPSPGAVLVIRGLATNRTTRRESRCCGKTPCLERGHAEGSGRGAGLARSIHRCSSIPISWMRSRSTSSFRRRSRPHIAKPRRRSLRRFEVSSVFLIGMGVPRRSRLYSGAPFVSCAAACFTSSPAGSRTTWPESTATLTPDHFPADKGAHLRVRFRFAPEPQVAGHVFEPGVGKAGSRTKEDPVAGFFHREFRGRPPRPRDANSIGQNDLAFGRKARGIHGKTPARSCKLARVICTRAHRVEKRPIG